MQKVDFNSQALTGLYYCPKCKERCQEELHISVRHLPLLINNVYDSRYLPVPVKCPHCKRPMWISRVFDSSGSLIFDLHQHLLRFSA
ncbi:MAG: hypothetical protein WAN36_00900 [Calditrichia bacterium]